jgi:hypothetical protein
VRWRFDIQSFLAEISLASLTLRARHHLDSEKQHNEQKHSPKEMGSDGRGGSLNHFGFSFVFIGFCPKPDLLMLDLVERCFYLRAQRRVKRKWNRRKPTYAEAPAR